MDFFREGGAGQHHSPPRGNRRHPLAAQHGEAHGREPPAAAAQGTGGAGEGGGQGGTADRVRRSGRRAP